MLDPKSILDDDGKQKALKDWPPEARAALLSYEIEDGKRKVKFHPKAPALITLAKHFKLMNDSQEITINLGLADKMKKARNRINK